MARGMHVPKLNDLPSVSALEDEEYNMVFQDGQRPLYSEGATLDVAVRHGIKQGKL